MQLLVQERAKASNGKENNFKFTKQRDFEYGKGQKFNVRKGHSLEFKKGNDFEFRKGQSLNHKQASKQVEDLSYYDIFSRYACSSISVQAMYGYY